MKLTNLTKNDLAKNLSKKTGFSVNFSKKLLNDLIISMGEIILKEKLFLKNLGTFNVLKKKKRLGRNPKTKKEFVISSRNSISFTTSKKILDTLNNF